VIVISGALVLVALVLLVIGLVSTALGFVYASIAVSVVSFLFLIVGIIQRRGETAPESAAATVSPSPANDVEGVTAIIPAARRPDPDLALAASEPAVTAPAAGDSSAAEGSVLVVEGRPRYHVEGCRYLAGKDASVLPVAEARSEGYTACGVCKPDDALAAVAAATTEDTESTAEVSADLAADQVEVPDPVTAARRTTRKAPAKAATKAVKAPAKRAAAKAPAKKAPAKKAPAAASGPSVVVIPDRGKYHRADCRFVRDVSGTEELSKAQASRQGYQACGVCKP
jgi:uncharacterized Zn finger protein (UPF0148 family)